MSTIYTFLDNYIPPSYKEDEWVALRYKPRAFLSAGPDKAWNRDEILCTFQEHQITHVFYWYCAAPCEGIGMILGRRVGGLWFINDLGHCSCHGPETGCRPPLRDFAPFDQLMQRELLHADVYSREHKLPLFAAAQAFFSQIPFMLESYNENTNNPQASP